MLLRIASQGADICFASSLHGCIFSHISSLLFQSCRERKQPHPSDLLFQWLFTTRTPVIFTKAVFIHNRAMLILLPKDIKGQ